MNNSVHTRHECGAINVTVNSQLTVPQIQEVEFAKEASRLGHRNQRSLANSILLVLTVTFAMIVNVRTARLTLYFADFIF